MYHPIALIISDSCQALSSISTHLHGQATVFLGPPLLNFTVMTSSDNITLCVSTHSLLFANMSLSEV